MNTQYEKFRNSVIEKYRVNDKSRRVFPDRFDITDDEERDYIESVAITGLGMSKYLETDYNVLNMIKFLCELYVFNGDLDNFNKYFSMAISKINEKEDYDESDFNELLDLKTLIELRKI